MARAERDDPGLPEEFWRQRVVERALTDPEEEEEVISEVEDYGMDGQPDFIVDYQTNSGSIFYLGAWRDVSGLGGGGTPTIEVDGERREIEDVLAELGRGAF